MQSRLSLFTWTAVKMEVGTARKAGDDATVRWVSRQEGSVRAMPHTLWWQLCSLRTLPRPLPCPLPVTTKKSYQKFIIIFIYAQLNKTRTKVCSGFIIYTDYACDTFLETITELGNMWQGGILAWTVTIHQKVTCWRLALLQVTALGRDWINSLRVL